MSQTPPTDPPPQPGDRIRAQWDDKDGQERSEEATVLAARPAGRYFVDIELDDGTRLYMVHNYEVIERAPASAAQPATAEPAYRCGQCGASGCRLFRPYQNVPYPGSLRCATCAAVSQGIDNADLAAGQIGWYVLAVPTTPRYDSFWGYTSVPAEPLAWWRSLPVKPAAAGGAS